MRVAFFVYPKICHEIGDKILKICRAACIFQPFISTANMQAAQGSAKEETTMSKWEIMQRVADTRKEIETFAQDWADVPGGTRNPLAVADWERLWRQLDELFAALRGCAVA